MNNQPIDRRLFLRGVTATIIGIPIGVSLASCATAGSPQPSEAATGVKSATNPFGLTPNTTIDAVIFNGGYGTDYVDFAGNKLTALHSGNTVKVTPTTTVATTLQPRFVGGTPPDLIDNEGANAIGINTIRAQLLDLNDVLDAENYEGIKIRDTLYPGMTAPGTYDGKFLELNYVLTVFAMYYSADLFEKNGWSVPKTWDELYSLGGKAKSAGKYLFGWGKEAATYYQTMVINSAIKEGGDEVRLALDNLKPGAWSLPTIQSVLAELKKIIDAGYVQPGGAGTQFTAAQAAWSNDEKFLLYPSGSWIENEMIKQTRPGFKMTGAPEPTVTVGSKLPYAAMHARADEGFIVPAQAKNAAGGKEVLRAMLSKEAVTNFAKTRLVPTIVKGTIPDDGFGSTALVSQSKMLNDAGANIFSWSFTGTYGTNGDQLVLWNTFLQGDMSVAELTKGLQEINDKVANDPDVKKVEVK